MKSFDRYVEKKGGFKKVEIISEINIENVCKYLRRARGNGNYIVNDRRDKVEYTVTIENKEIRFWNSLCW